MNSTYSKELSSSMKNSRKEFVKEQYELDHKQSAAKLSLYYAHGQTEKNENNFKSTKQDSDSSELLDSKAVKACNLAENVVVAAKQSLVDSGRATSNVSTAAANMQIAANTINKLASDVAAMNSISVNANNESAIQEHTARANKMVQHAARLAEDVSLDSMHATIEAAQATASTVVTNSEAALEAVKSLQGATASRYSELSQEAVAAKTELTEARKNEKLASATYDVSTKQDQAITNTRSIIDKVSNNNLQLIDSVVWDSQDGKPQFHVPYGIGKGDSYSVMWDAFRDEEDIKSYRIIMVKLDDSEAFDINIAHELNKGSYYSVDPAHSGATKYHKTFFLLDAELKVLPQGDTEHVLIDKTEFTKVRKHVCVDYKGKPIERGTYYVAYIYAEYKPKKQIKIDSMVGELSQPSLKLRLQAPLYHTETPTIHTPYFNSRNVAVSIKVPTMKYDPSKIDFRVMLIESKNVLANTINKQIDQAIAELEEAEFHYNALQNKQNERQEQLDEQLLREMSLEQRLNPYDGDIEEVSEEKLKSELKDASQQVKDLQVIIYGGKKGNDTVVGLTDKVAKAKESYEEAQKYEANQSKRKISDFRFDEDSMKTVAAGSYVTATPIKWDLESATAQFIEKITKAIGLNAKLFDMAKFISEEKSIEAGLQVEYDKALDAVRTAQAQVDTLALGSEDDSSSGASGDKKQGKASAKKTSGKLGKVDEDELAKAYRELKIKQGFLNVAEKNLRIYKEVKEDHAGDLSTLVNKYVKAKFELERAEEILRIFTHGDQFLVERIVKKKGFAKRGDLYEPINDTSDDDDNPTDDLLVLPESVLLYTEMGEDATDNYGEPLYMNQKSYLDQAVAQFKEVLDGNGVEDKAIRSAMSELTMEKILETFGKDSTGNISYDAMIFSALTTAYVQDEDEYDYTHSPYSSSVTLYQVAE